MPCFTPELFAGMVLAACDSFMSYPAARAGLKLANPPLLLVLLRESLRLDLNSCKTKLTSVQFHSSILFRKSLESSVQPRLEKIPESGKLFTHYSIKYLCFHQRHGKHKYDDYLSFEVSSGLKFIAKLFHCHF